MTKHVSLFLKSILSVAAFLIASVSFAQGNFTVKFKLIDEKTSEPVSFATASLTVKGETKAVKYVLTNDEGAGEIVKVKKGTYKFKAELMGYTTYEKEIVVNKNIELGTLKMAEDVKVLDAASVSAVGNPIVVKKDTIEYNASSFKTSDNDMLEDLLKKLPGVEVASDGTVTANGETIKKITIDGKTFFLDDPQLATKNLPAKLVEKVKVVERKSEQARFTGIDDGQQETIIDLSVYKGMMNGWFGNVMGGGGHDLPEDGYYTEDKTFMDEGWRYQTAGILGNFKSKSQISIIVNANNTNNRGFNDLAGGMMRGMMGGGRRMGGGGFGGMGGGNGITSSWMGGLNGAWDLLDDRMELSSNYLYNGSTNYVEETSSKVTFMENGSHMLNDNNGYSTNGSQGHRIGVRLDYEFNKNTSLLFEPQFNFGTGSFSEHSDLATRTAMNADTTFTNSGFTDNKGNNRNWTASGRLLYRQRLGKEGRTLSALVNYSFSNNEMSGLNQSLTRTDLNADNVFENEIVNQRYDQISNNSSLSGRMVFTEPLAENLFLEANYEYAWNSNRTGKDTYNSGDVNFADDATSLVYNYIGEVYDPTYSSSILNNYVNQRAGTSLTWQTQDLNAQVGIQINPTDTHNETNGETYDNKVVNWSPSARIRYMVNENAQLMVNYDGRSSQPSTSQLMPVPDNTDPLNVSLGNPYLESYFTHNMRGTFRFTNRTTFTSVNAQLGGNFVQDAITNAQWYDQSGAQYSIPVNGPGTGSANASIMVNSPIAKSDFSIMSNTSARYNQSVSYIGTGTLNSDLYYDPDNAEFNYVLFHKDYPSLGDSDAFLTNKIRSLNVTEMLRLTYRNDFVELVAGGRTNVSKSWYTMKSANVNTTWNNNVSFEMNWTLPFGMNLISDMNYNWYRGYTTAQEPEFILNAEITQLVFNKKGTIALRAYDIFKQAKNLMVTDASNYHQEVRNNTLGRYVIVSFTYRFGTFSRGRGGAPYGGPRGMGGPAGGPSGRPAGGGMRGGMPAGGPPRM